MNRSTLFILNLVVVFIAAVILMHQSAQALTFFDPLGGTGVGYPVDFPDSESCANAAGQKVIWVFEEGLGLPGFLQTDTPTKFIGALFQLGLGLAGVTALIVLIIGGIQYMLSEVPGIKMDARGKITNAILGLIIILAAVLILNTISPQFVNLKEEPFPQADTVVAAEDRACTRGIGALIPPGCEFRGTRVSGGNCPAGACNTGETCQVIDDPAGPFDPVVCCSSAGPTCYSTGNLIPAIFTCTDVQASPNACPAGETCDLRPGGPSGSNRLFCCK